MSRLFGVLATLLLALVVYLLAWPVPITPQAWSAPESPGYTGAYARNDKLAAARLVSIAPEVGPEHIAFGPDGKLYTGVLSGWVLRMNPDGTSAEKIADTGGRPLGLDFDASGQLIIADALRGLLALPLGGTLRVLADSVALDPIRYADAVKVAADGKILLTDASTRISPADHGTFDAALLDILEQSCSGRVLEFDPSTSAVRTIADHLCFPNGVALADDEQALIVAETGIYRVVKIARSAELLDARAAIAAGDPRITVLLDNLPGFPDNVTQGADGRYWTGLTKPRSAAIDRMDDKPWLRAMLLRLPKAFWPVPPGYGHVIAFDAHGRVLANLQDPSGRLPETSGATEHDGVLYIQSLHAAGFGVLPLTPGPTSRQSP